jgi:hypothetical protein
MYKKYLSIVILCAYSCSNADVLKNSIIDTRDGQKLAVEIRKGNILDSVEKDKKRLAEVMVSDAITSKTNSIFEIQLEGKVIRAVQDQTFFDPMMNRWVKAKDLTNKNHLLGSDSKHIPVLSTVKKTGEFETVKIMVDGSNYFYVDGVLTHNFWPLLIKIGTFIGKAVAEVLVERAVVKTGEKLTGSKEDEKVTEIHHHHHTTNNYTNNHPSDKKPVKTFNIPQFSGARGT